MFLALWDRAQKADEHAFFGFACLMADNRNLNPYLKHDHRYSAHDFLPSESLVKHVTAKQFAEIVKGGGYGD